MASPVPQIWPLFFVHAKNMAAVFLTFHKYGVRDQTEQCTLPFRNSQPTGRMCLWRHRPHGSACDDTQQATGAVCSVSGGRLRQRLLHGDPRWHRACGGSGCERGGPVSRRRQLRTTTGAARVMQAMLVHGSPCRLPYSRNSVLQQVRGLRRRPPAAAWGATAASTPHRPSDPHRRGHTGSLHLHRGQVQEPVRVRPTAMFRVPRLPQGRGRRVHLQRLRTGFCPSSAYDQGPYPILPRHQEARFEPGEHHSPATQEGQGRPAAQKETQAFGLPHAPAFSEAR